jgi:hypothetical protein
MKELSVFSGSDLVDRGGVEVHENGSGDVFVVAGLVEEGLKGSRITDIGIWVGAAIGLQAMLEEISDGPN